jgi:hypothetical protein
MRYVKFVKLIFKAIGYMTNSFVMTTQEDPE